MESRNYGKIITRGTSSVSGIDDLHEYRFVVFDYDRWLSADRKIKVKAKNAKDALTIIINNGPFYIGYNNYEETISNIEHNLQKDYSLITDQEMIQYAQDVIEGDGEGMILLMEDENKNLLIKDQDSRNTFDNYRSEYEDDQDDETYSVIGSEIKKFYEVLENHHYTEEDDDDIPWAE